MSSRAASGPWPVGRALPNDRITLEGIGKTDGDLRAAVRAAAAGEPLRWIAVESADEAAALARAVTAVRRRRRAAANRCASTPSCASTRASRRRRSAGLATGGQSAKFGVSPDEVGAVFDAGGGIEGPIRWRGLHLHVGSQLGAVDAWRDAVRRALALLGLLRGGMPDFDTLDVGGGMPAHRGRRRPGTGWRPRAGWRELVPGPFPVPRLPPSCPRSSPRIPVDRRPLRLASSPGAAGRRSTGWLVARVLHVRERTLPPAPVAETRSGSPCPGRGAAGLHDRRPHPPAGRHRRRHDRADPAGPLRRRARRRRPDVPRPGSASRRRAPGRRGSTDRSASRRTRSGSTCCRRSAVATWSRSPTPGPTQRRCGPRTTVGPARPR